MRRKRKRDAEEKRRAEEEEKRRAEEEEMRLAEEETRLGYVSGSDAAPTLPPTVCGALRSPQAAEGRWIRLLRPPERALAALEPTGARAQRRRTGSANAAPIAHPWRSGEAT